MNLYFYRIFLPYTILAIFGLYLVVNDLTLINYTIVFWLLLGPIGLGLGFHRLFSHRQFETYRPIELFFALLGTLSSYGPLLFWVSSHQQHHKYTDTEKDPTTPLRGFWHCVMTWNLKKTCEKEIILKSYPCIMLMRDKSLMWLSKNFFIINYVFLLVLVIIDYKIAIGGYILATAIERLRIGFFVNYLLHSNIFGSYKVANNQDHSINIIWLYPLTMGFSFHNQHHFNPKSHREKTKWFEIDVEYYFCKLLSKNDKNFKTK